MALTLPEARDVVFDKSPIRQVICQVRFPPILRIESEKPAELQDKLRGKYPHLRQEQGLQVDLGAPEGDEGESPRRATVTPPLWAFSSSDEEWTVSLTREFVALSTGENYQTFDELRDRLAEVFQGFRSVYDPAHATRVGLRYINQLVEPAGAPSDYWVARLQPLYVAAFQPDGTPGELLREMRELWVSYGDDAITIRHGYLPGGDQVDTPSCLTLTCTGQAR